MASVDDYDIVDWLLNRSSHRSVPAVKKQYKDKVVESDAADLAPKIASLQSDQVPLPPVKPPELTSAERNEARSEDSKTSDKKSSVDESTVQAQNPDKIKAKDKPKISLKADDNIDKLIESYKQPEPTPVTPLGDNGDKLLSDARQGSNSNIVPADTTGSATSATTPDVAIDTQTPTSISANVGGTGSVLPTVAGQEPVNATTDQAGIGVLDTTASKVPVFARQNENVEAATGQDAPNAPQPAVSGEVPPTPTQEVPSFPSVDPMSVVIPPMATDTTDPTLKGLSDDFKRATAKPISVGGISIDPASPTYEVADAASRGFASANAGIVSLPFLARRLGSFLYYPIDKALGTELQKKHIATTDQMEKGLDALTITKQPETLFERGMFALGAASLPFPALTAAAKPGADATKALVAEALLPGTVVRPGASASTALGTSIAGGAVVNEGLYQTLNKLQELRKANPPVPNSKGDEEPRVTSVDPDTAKLLQGQINSVDRSWLPQFAEANYGKSVLAVGAGILGAYGLYRGLGRVLAQPLESRTVIPNAAGKAPPTLESGTTAGEALRTIHQNYTHVLESQAKRAGDTDLSFDIPLQTRGGLDARMEAARNTGTINTPGYNYQLTTSPKALAEFHLSRPLSEQQDLSWALHTMDQVDHATIGTKQRATAAAQKVAGEPVTKPNAPYTKMPAEGDVQRAQAILADPSNAATVNALKEMRIAQAGVMESAGRWDAATKQAMLSERPNYVHNIHTDDYVTDAAGVSRPMTRAEQFQSALNRKSDEVVDRGITYPQDLSPAVTRKMVDKEPVMFDAVMSNIIAMEQTQRFAYENSIRSRFVRGLENSNNDLAQSVVKQKGNRAAPENSKSATFWEGGKEQTYHLEPLVANALTFNAPNAMRWASVPKNILQYTTTGPIAPWFLWTNAALDATLASATKMRGTRLGYVDQALQATVGDIPAPGKMLGAYAAMSANAFNAIRTDKTLHMAQQLEQALLQSPSMGLQDVKAAFGDDYVKRLSQGFAAGHSVTAQGLVENARRMYADSPKGFGMREGALHSSRTEMMKGIQDFDSRNVKDAFIREMGAGGSMYHQYISKYLQAAVDTKNGYLSSVSDIHDATRLAYIKQNPQLPNNVLANEVRNLTGDLNKQGMGNTTGYTLRDKTIGDRVANAALKTITNKPVGGTLDAIRQSIPYLNPHIQGMQRLAKAVKDRPIATVSNIASVTMFPQIAALSLAASLGPEYLDHMLNKREEYKKTNYIYFPIPGLAPDKGLEFRLDPLLTPFSYPLVEAADSVFGLRQYAAAKLNKQNPDAQTQGVVDALQDAFKEYVGVGAPWPVQMGAALFGQTSMRNVFDPTYQVQAERLSGAGENVKNNASALSAPVQIMLEQLFGTGAQIGIHGLDAYNADRGFVSGLASGAKQIGIDVASKMPVAGNTFFGPKYNQPGTTLAQNTRKLLNAVRKIEAVGSSTNKDLLQTKTKRPGEDTMETPNLMMGNVGNPQLPEGFDQVAMQAHEALKASGEVKVTNSERRRISNNLAGLRGVNAGNIGRYVKVPLPEGKELAGINYIILHQERMKEEGASEKYGYENPTLTPKTGKIAAESRQRPKPLGGIIGEERIRDSRLQGFKPPSYKEINELMTALNRRRDALDIRAATALEKLQKDGNFDFVKIADQIKGDPRDENDIDD